MSESVCHSAGGEGRTRDCLAQVHHMQLRNKSNCLAGDFSGAKIVWLVISQTRGKPSALLCPESTTLLLPCFREVSPAHCIGPHLDHLHLLWYPLDHQHMRVEAARVGRAGGGLVCMCRSFHLCFALWIDFKHNAKAPNSIGACPDEEPLTHPSEASAPPKPGRSFGKQERGEKAVTEGPELS